MKKLFIIIITGLLLQTAFAQCLPDRHSTSWYDGWASCSATQSPNPARGISHWIMYNFGEPYSLATSTFWNSNDPAHLEYGLQGYAVDYSLDGNTWTALGTFSAEKASGSPFYEGTEGPDFNKAVAQYVLFTALSNYGGNCYGFSELKINIDSTTNSISEEKPLDFVAYPNPFTDKLNIKLFSTPENKKALINVHDLTGRIVYSKTISGLVENNEITLENQEMKLVAGVYTIEINNARIKTIQKIIKL